MRIAAEYVIPNGRVDRTHLYDELFPGLLDDRGHHRAAAEIRAWPGYAPTPLVQLPSLAAALGVRSLAAKDEGGRFGLGSFKALGGAYAVYCALGRAVKLATDRWPDAAALAAGEYSDIVDAITVTCATEGNHGRAVAWGAQMFGCRAIVYLPRGVSAARTAAIAAHGAALVQLPGTYDDAVRIVQEDAERHGRTVISDTAYAEAEEVPVEVMQGYTVLAGELIEQWGDTPPTHVFVQGGVGGLAAAVAAHLWRSYGPNRPHFTVVEPEAAACLLESARSGHTVTLEGDLHTVMSCLACGVPSSIAWRILDRAADAFIAIPDAAALVAVRRLAAENPPITAGESGAAGIAALLALADTPQARALLRLDRDARVVCIVTEGANDPVRYGDIVAGR